MGKKYTRYDDEFKREAVRLVQDSGKTAVQIADDLGIDVKNLYNWIRMSKDTGPLTDHGKEIARLKKELARTERERDILKKAVAIFSQHQK